MMGFKKTERLLFLALVLVQVIILYVTHNRDSISDVIHEPNLAELARVAATTTTTTTTKQQQQQTTTTAGGTCHTPEHVTETWIQRIPNFVRSDPIRLPSKQRPFIFFHARKAGGSSVRKWLNRAAQELKLPRWIVCENNIPCDNYIMPPQREGRKAIYAGHLYYSDALNTLQFTKRRNNIDVIPPAKTTAATGNHHHHRHPPPPFDCIVAIRPTVSRVCSCWNFRFGVAGKRSNFRPAQSVPAEQWARDLPRAYSYHQEGCNNEFMRVFGSHADEVLINQWSLLSSSSSNNNNNNNETIIPNNHARAVVHDCMSEFELNLIMGRLSHCIVTHQKFCNESRIVVQHYLPWLAPHWKCEEHYQKHNRKFIPKQNVSSASSPPSSTSLVDLNAQQEILKQNFMDEQVFQFAEQLFKEQLRVATTRAIAN